MRPNDDGKTPRANAGVMFAKYLLQASATPRANAGVMFAKCLLQATVTPRANVGDFGKLAGYGPLSTSIGRRDPTGETQPR